MRRRWLAPLIVLGPLGLLQTTLLYPLSFLGIRPHFLWVAVGAWALARGAREGMVWGFVGGLVTDFLSTAPWGAYTLVTTVIGALAGVGETNIFRTNPLLPLLAIVLATLSYDLAGLVILHLTGATLSLDTSLGRLMLLTTLLNAFVMFLIQQAAQIVGHVFGRRWVK